MTPAAASWATLSERIGARLATDADGERAVLLLGELFDELLVNDLHGTLPARIIGAMRIRRDIAAAPKDAPDLDGVAVHESAHATKLHNFGYQVVNVTVDPVRDFGAQGVTFFTGHTPHTAFSFAERERIEQRVLIELAGPVAQEIALQAYGLELPTRIWETHRQEAAAFVRRMPPRLVGDDPFAFVEWMTARTKSDVRRSWVTIRALADKLLEVRTMTGDEVHAFITALHLRDAAAVATEAAVAQVVAA